MKSRKQVYCENRIIQLRSELHRLVEHEQLSSCSVQKVSKELDDLIMLYYKMGDNPTRSMSGFD